MCGIAGCLVKNKVDKVYLNKTQSIMHKRGPDARGRKTYKSSDYYVEFLHSRLSIIDDQPRSDQPMEFEGYSLIFNGEIYNYIELRNKLESIGYEFKTNSDTEVLLKMLIHYGAEALSYLDGMWAFAFLDKEKNNLMLSRDTFSEKPLYFYQENKDFFFGSSISYILSLSNKRPVINKKKIEQYLRFDFKSIYINNETFINDVYSLEPGSCVIVSKGEIKSIKHKKQYSETSTDYGIDFYKNEVKDSLITSLERRMRSDKPFTFLLSGGLDSSTLCYLAKKELNKDISCFSIGGDDHRYNESKNINHTIKDLNCDHTFLKPKFDGSEIGDSFSKFSEEFLSPLPGQNYLLYSELNSIIKSKGFKVVISGHGGDELYGGYFIHQNHFIREESINGNNDKAISDFNSFIKPRLRNKNLANLDKVINKQYKFIDNFEESESISKYFNAKISLDLSASTLVKPSFNFFKNRLEEDMFNLTLPQHVVASDQISMYHSLENRAPFLSRAVYEIARKIPNKYLIKDGYGKFILRESMRGIVPDSILWDRDKKGFNFEFSINNISNFHILFTDIDKIDFLKNLINFDKVDTLLSKKDMTNAESKLLFRIANIKYFLESVVSH
jgi:asparagine synthase (glutamine-hydrolysing)